MTPQNPKIAQVVVGLPIEGPFDYSVNLEQQKSICLGQRVRVLFNRRVRLGIVVHLKEKSPFKKLNPILSILDSIPAMDSRALSLTKTISEYYGCSWGETIETYLPAGLRRHQFNFDLDVVPGAESVSESRFLGTSDQANITLINYQDQEDCWTILKKQMEEVLQTKKAIIFLVPEKFLIERVVTRLNQWFSVSIAVLDRPLKSNEEIFLWKKIKTNKTPIVVGTRSAIFAPLSELGLIVIWEEENSAYKQEQVPHYDAREVALMRSLIDNCAVILTSSAPTAASWERARRSKWKKISLAGSLKPDIVVLDMNNYNIKRATFLSFPLQTAILKALGERKKILLFMNRRGFTTMTRCNSCGFILKCERCDSNLAYLYSKKMLVCPHCNFQKALPKICPNCQSTYLRSMGVGIEKLESEVSRFYPQARITHLDKDTDQMPQNFDILIATQAIVKFKGMVAFDLTGVINFDSELNRNDFRSTEKAFGLLMSLCQLTKEKLLVQTRLADHYCLRALTRKDIEKFYREELSYRRELKLPPFRHLAAVAIRGRDEELVFEHAKNLYEYFLKKKAKSIEVSDPHPDTIAKLRDQYHYSVVLKGQSIPSIVKLAKAAVKETKQKKDIIVTLNVDP